MTVLWTGQGRGEENVADVELEGVEYSRGLGGLSLCLWSKRKEFGDGICERDGFAWEVLHCDGEMVLCSKHK